jgi:cytidylate kinase
MSGGDGQQPAKETMPVLDIQGEMGDSHSPQNAAYRPLIIAIDGPAGAGKSTLAAHLAARFALLNLETGAMYRAFALKALERGCSPDDSAQLETLLHHTEITLEPTSDGNRVWLDGVDVTARLRDPEVTSAASRVSVHPPVREWLVGLQKAMGNGPSGVVMEGRDIGNAVFPHAQVKIFLDASPEKRSERRYAQAPVEPAATSLSPEEVLRAMRERDQRDRNRPVSPLRPAPDAVIIDSTYLTLDEVIAQAEAIVLEHWPAARS